MDSNVGFPTVSGNVSVKSPERMDKTPINTNGNDGLINLRLSVKNGAGVAPTRADNEAKLSPCVLKN